MNDFTDIVSKVMEVRPDDGDYTGEDGLLYCVHVHLYGQRYSIWSILPKPDAILPAFSPGIPAGIRSIRSLMGKPSKSRRYPNGT